MRSHLVVARPRRKALELPSGVTAVPLKIRGKRVAVRNAETFQRAVQITARWPLDGMHELRIPKIIIVTSGRAGIRAGDYVLQCPAGSLIFIPPGVAHTDGTCSHLETLFPEVQHCSLLWLTPMMSGLACRMCHSRGQEHNGAAQGEKVFLHHPQIMQLMNMLVEEVIKDENDTPSWNACDTAVFESLIFALMRSIVRDVENRRFLLQEIAPDHGDDPGNTGSAIEQAANYINLHYASHLTLDDVARRFFFSRAQFTRKFRDHTGQSFLEYLHQRRLEQAKKLLRETQWTAVMITNYVGFGSSAYFHRFFKREMGVSPMEYRTRARRENEDLRAKSSETKSIL